MYKYTIEARGECGNECNKCPCGYWVLRITSVNVNHMYMICEVDVRQTAAHNRKVIARKTAQ